MLKRHILKKKILPILVCIFLLFISFFANLFGTGKSDEWFMDFQKDSALIVQKTAGCKGAINYDGPLVPRQGYDYMDVMQGEGCSEGVYKPYDSQYGLQARIISLFAPDTREQMTAYFLHVEMVLALLMSFIFTAFVFRVSRVFNKKVAIITLVFIVSSPWLVAFARNTYWVTFLMFLPFIFTFILYPWFKDSRRIALFYILLGALLFLKLLNGYEHITTLMISALVPVVFYEIWLYNRVKLRDFLKPSLLVFTVGIVALASAVLINAASLASYYGSWPKALRLVTARAEDRSAGLLKVQPNVVGGFKATLPDAYAFVDKFYDLDSMEDGKSNPIKYAALSVLNYALLPAVSFPLLIREPLGTFMQSIAAVALISYVALRSIRKRSELPRKQVLALKYGFWLSVAGSFSWLVLMPGHAYPHAHLNAIIFYMPLMLICYIIIGIFITQLREHFIRALRMREV